MSAPNPGALRIVLGDQLTRTVAALRDIDPVNDTVLMVEVAEEATYVRHHKKKIAFLFSAMRHFAKALEEEGIRVVYVRLDDPGNTGSFTGEVVRWSRELRPARIVATFPGEWRVLEAMRGWGAATGLPVEIREDDRFFCPIDGFKRWAEDRKALRMEFFYRDLRRRTGLLMAPDGEPQGGQWNFDSENRKSLPRGLVPPEPFGVPPDPITTEVLALVGERFADHFGDLEPFFFAVTARDAERAFAHFVERSLPYFGDYQDAMKTGEPVLFHAWIALYMNAGLLDPKAVCRAVETAYLEGRVPLNAAEGFIRQILGWREYVRGIYWLKMPGYAAMNALAAQRPLPAFYWTGETDMACLADCVATTRRHAYAHHIQRLMVLGNFALIAGLDPAEVNEWYLVVYADAYEWVEMPNVTGMILYADGGTMGSKPYAASGKYINRMSDYCGRCRYDVRQGAGPDACPFNYLYWNFLIENRPRLRLNQRLGPMYQTLDRMDPQKVEGIRHDSGRFFERLRVEQVWERPK